MGQVRFYPYKKEKKGGGGGDVLAMLEGGSQKVFG